MLDVPLLVIVAVSSIEECFTAYSTGVRSFSLVHSDMRLKSLGLMSGEKTAFFLTFILWHLFQVKYFDVQTDSLPGTESFCANGLLIDAVEGARESPKLVSELLKLFALTFDRYDLILHVITYDG